MKTLLRTGMIVLTLGKALIGYAVRKPFSPRGVTIARELRKSFEALGTTFIKFGQLVGMNPGIFPESFVEEFKRCLDNVSPLPWAVIKETLENELGEEALTFFTTINEQPISSASIAQVHRATLPDGAEVAVKVQRPGIADIINVDIDVLYFFFGLLLKLFPSLRPANPMGLIRKFDEKIHEELDFLREGSHCEQFARIFAEDDDIVVPRIFWHLTSARVLTAEYIDGIKVTETDRLRETGADFSRTARVGMKVLVRSAFGKGFFHGDMHAANIIVMADGKIGFIDFGLMETLSKDTKGKVLVLLQAVYRNDFMSAAMMMKEISRPDSDVDEQFYEDVRVVGEKYLCTSLAGRNWREFLIETLNHANKYHLRLPLALVLLIKQLLYLDGLGRMMDHQHDLLHSGAFFSEYFSVLLQTDAE